MRPSGEAHDRDVGADEADAPGDELPGAEEIPEVEADRALTRREQRLRAVAIEHTHVAQHDLGPEPAQPRVDALVLDPEPRLLLDPRLHAAGVFRHLRDREAQRAERDRREDDQGRQHACRDTPRTGGRRAGRVFVHMSTTSYWSWT